MPQIYVLAAFLLPQGEEYDNRNYHWHDHHYVAIMMGIGVYTARQTRSVSDFVLGGHSVGSWLTAFAYGTSYFPL